MAEIDEVSRKNNIFHIPITQLTFSFSSILEGLLGNFSDAPRDSSDLLRLLDELKRHYTQVGESFNTIDKARLDQCYLCATQLIEIY